MNRSFRGPETLMPSIRPRVPQLKSLHSSTMREKEDDLALFLEMRKREKEKNDLLLHDSGELDESLGIIFIIYLSLLFVLLLMICVLSFV